MTAPLLLLTLGVFLLVINAALLMLTSWVADQLHLGWHVDGFWSAFWGALIVSIVCFILNSSFLPRARVTADVGQVVFVCWGNICRSPMAERVAQGWAERDGLDGVGFTSAGVSREEPGNPIDPRAQRVLTRHGYRTAGTVPSGSPRPRSRRPTW